MQPSPHAGLLPVPQPPPAAHARAALHLDRQPLPQDARAQNEQDARQSSLVLKGEDDRLVDEASRQEEVGQSPARERRGGSVWPSSPTRRNPFC